MTHIKMGNNEYNHDQDENNHVLSRKSGGIKVVISFSKRCEEHDKAISHLKEYLINV